MYNVVYCSMQGQEREINEDALLVQDTILKEAGTTELDVPYLLAVVADGMGGYAKGELASFTVLDSLRKSKPKDRNELVISLMEAKNRLNEIALKEKIELGTAVAGVLSENGNFAIFNVGDCRVYKITASGEVVAISEDHTLANQLKEFNINDEVLEKQKNVLTSAIIGGSENEDFEIFYDNLVLDCNEKLLICSDGFWNTFEGEIRKMVYKRDVIKFVKKNIKYKNMNDDYSFILIEEQNKTNNLLLLFYKVKQMALKCWDFIIIQIKSFLNKIKDKSL